MSRLLSNRLTRFVAVGAVSTIGYLVVYVLLRLVASAQVANVLAFLVTALGNTALNRRFTFGLSGRASTREHTQGLVVFAVGVGLSSAALALLHSANSHPGRVTEVAVLLASTAAATVLRFVVFSRWIFAASSSGDDPQEGTSPR